MESTNLAVARRFFQSVWNERKIEVLDELLTPESVCQSENGIIRGKDEFLAQVFQPFVTAFPDLQIEIEEAITQRDVVAVRWLCTATHTGAAFGLAPTGRRVSFRGTSWIRIDNGQMMEGFECWNVGGLMQVLSGGPGTPALYVD